LDSWLPTQKAKKLSISVLRMLGRFLGCVRSFKRRPPWNHRCWHTFSTLSFRDSPQCPLQIAFLRRMSLINANQWRLGHFHNLPGTQRGRKTFRLVLQTALSPGTVLLDVGSRIHRANARKALKEHHPSGLRSHHWLSTMCSPTRRLVKRARFLPAVPLPQRTPRLMKK
jgi:hypothetical protein